MDLCSGVRDLVVVEPPCEQTHAGSGDELRGRLELHRVALPLGELGMEVGSNKVLDVLVEDADDQVSASLARERLPELSVLFHVSKDREDRLKEFPVTSRRLLGRLALYGQGRANVLESGRQQGLFVAVVRVEGGSAHVGAIEDVLDGEASRRSVTASLVIELRSRTIEPVVFASERNTAIGC